MFISCSIVINISLRNSAIPRNYCIWKSPWAKCTRLEATLPRSRVHPKSGGRERRREIPQKNPTGMPPRMPYTSPFWTHRPNRKASVNIRRKYCPWSSWLLSMSSLWTDIPFGIIYWPGMCLQPPVAQSICLLIYVSFRCLVKRRSSLFLSIYISRHDAQSRSFIRTGPLDRSASLQTPSSTQPSRKRSKVSYVEILEDANEFDEPDPFPAPESADPLLLSTSQSEYIFTRVELGQPAAFIPADQLEIKSSDSSK